jgi:hypothetical protein
VSTTGTLPINKLIPVLTELEEEAALLTSLTLVKQRRNTNKTSRVSIPVGFDIDGQQVTYRYRAREYMTGSAGLRTGKAKRNMLNTKIFVFKSSAFDKMRCVKYFNNGTLHWTGCVSVPEIIRLSNAFLSAAASKMKMSYVPDVLLVTPHMINCPFWVTSPDGKPLDLYRLCHFMQQRGWKSARFDIDISSALLMDENRSISFKLRVTIQRSGYVMMNSISFVDEANVQLATKVLQSDLLDFIHGLPAFAPPPTPPPPEPAPMEDVVQWFPLPPPTPEYRYVPCMTP